MSENLIFKAAHNIRFHLAELVSVEEANRIDIQLGELLSQAKSCEDVQKDLINVLYKNEKIKQWVGAFIQAETHGEKGYSDFPGNNSIPLETDKYMCPEPNCAHLWFRRTIEETIPQCPQHHILLVLKA